VSGPDHPRLRVVDADSSFLSQIEAATERFVATSGNPPPLPWFIEEWVPADETTLLAGPGSGGKSYLALQMQASAALGVPIGRRSPRIRGPYSMPIHSAADGGACHGRAGTSLRPSPAAVACRTSTLPDPVCVLPALAELSIEAWSEHARALIWNRLCLSLDEPAGWVVARASAGRGSWLGHSPSRVPVRPSQVRATHTAGPPAASDRRRNCLPAVAH
jgi:AAA domain